MTNITLKLTERELDLLTSLASDQLFRREFIDPKMPGHKSDPSEIHFGKELVQRLRQVIEPARGTAKLVAARKAR